MKVLDLLNTWGSEYYKLVYISDGIHDDFLFEGGVKECMKSEFANKKVKIWVSEDIMPDKISNIIITI